MTATDELRRLLDERGVKWWQRKRKTKWSIESDKGRTTFWACDCHDGTLTVGNDGICNLTPAQAVEATLGEETRADVWRDLAVGLWRSLLHCSQDEARAWFEASAELRKVVTDDRD